MIHGGQVRALGGQNSGESSQPPSSSGRVPKSCPLLLTRSSSPERIRESHGLGVARQPSTQQPSMRDTTSQTPVANAAAATDTALAGEPTDELLHWILLSLSAAVLVLAVALQVRGEEQVVIPVIDIPVPGTCSFKAYVGVDCPGCGLTRCFVSVAHGQLGRAWHYNPVGIFFFAVVATQLPFRTLQIWRLRQGLSEVRLGWWSYWLLFGVAIALLVQWVLRMILSLL